MKKRYRIQPSKGSSFMGMIMGGVFCFVGLFFVTPIFGAFGAIWTLFAVVITVSNGYAYFKDKNIMGHDIIVEDDEKDFIDNNSSKSRLNEIKKLYDEGLITKEEYDKKRKEIIDKI